MTEPGGEVFLELKKKYKGIAYKRRIMLPEDAAGEFIAGRARSVNIPLKTANSRSGFPLRLLAVEKASQSLRSQAQIKFKARAGVSECAAASRSLFKRESNEVGLV